MTACNDPRHDEIETWYRQVLEARSTPAEALDPLRSALERLLAVAMTDTPAAPTLRERLMRFAPSDDDYSVVEFADLVNEITALAEARATAPPPLDVERLTEAMDFDRVEAMAIIEKHGFVFATQLDKPLQERTDAEKWEALAFFLYTMLLPSNRRSEKIAAEYARLTDQSREEDR